MGRVELCFDILRYFHHKVIAYTCSYFSVEDLWDERVGLYLSQSPIPSLI